MLRAQAPAQPTTVVRVVVTDSAGRPISQADVALVRGLRDSIARGASDSAGVRTFVIPTDNSPYQVIVRKIGYYRAERFFASKNQASVRVVVDMRRVIQALAEVRIKTMADPKRRAYFIDADEIANSSRTIIDASDIITKLKPDMTGSRVPPSRDPDCIGMKEIWVNGRRTWSAMGFANDRATQRMAGQRGRRGQATPTGALGALNMTILMEIHPEHIAEMSFRDCYDTQMEGTGKKNALFIVLKPGIAYNPGRESYAIDNGPPPPRARGSVAAAPPPAAIRILGVFDDSTGQPVEGAKVVGDGDGTYALTTVTGTVSLAFLPPGTSSIHIAKSGYVEYAMRVTLSPQDTVPITVLLKRAP